MLKQSVIIIMIDVIDDCSDDSGDDDGGGIKWNTMMGRYDTDVLLGLSVLECNTTRETSGVEEAKNNIITETFRSHRTGLEFCGDSLLVKHGNRVSYRRLTSTYQVLPRVRSF